MKPHKIVISIWTVVSHETTGVNETYTVVLDKHKDQLAWRHVFFSHRLIELEFPLQVRPSSSEQMTSHLSVTWFMALNWNPRKKVLPKRTFQSYEGSPLQSLKHIRSHEHKICCEVSEQEPISWPFDVRHDETRCILVHSFDANQMSCNVNKTHHMT